MPGSAVYQVADRVLALGLPASFHVDQDGGTVRGIALSVETADDIPDVLGRRVAFGRDDAAAFFEGGRDECGPRC